MNLMAERGGLEEVEGRVHGRKEVVVKRVAGLGLQRGYRG
jgi:hypothetical protein